MKEIVSLPFEAAMRHHDTCDALNRTRAKLAAIVERMRAL